MQPPASASCGSCGTRVPLRRFTEHRKAHLVAAALAVVALTACTPSDMEPVPAVDVTEVREDCQSAGGIFQTSQDADGTYAGCDYSGATR